MGNGRAALYSLPISVVEIHPASPPPIFSIKNYQVPIPNTQHEFVTPKWPPPPKKTLQLFVFFFWLLHFFGVTNSIAVFRNRPRHLYISNALSSWRMEGPHEGVMDHEETTETRETRSSLRPTPPGHKPGHFFLVFSPSEKNRVSQRKNDFQLNSPRLQCLGIQCLLKQLSEFDYLILPHNIMAVVTISPVILSCFNIKKCYVHVSVFMYILCVCVCVCRFNSTIFYCSILRMYIYISYLVQ